MRHLHQGMPQEQIKVIFCLSFLAKVSIKKGERELSFFSIQRIPAYAYTIIFTITPIATATTASPTIQKIEIKFL